MLLELAVSAELWIVSGELRDARKTHEQRRRTHAKTMERERESFTPQSRSASRCIQRIYAEVFTTAHARTPRHDAQLHGAPLLPVARATCTACAHGGDRPFDAAKSQSMQASALDPVLR